MSEPSSLYVRVRLTEKKFEEFRNSPLVAPNHYNDWRSWLSAKKFYGEITDAEVQAMTPSTEVEGSKVKSVGEYLSLLLQDPYAGPSQSLYDVSSNTWTLCVMGLSENYKDFILALSILRSIEEYKDIAGEDFILIYPYFWEAKPEAFVNAYVTISSGSSRIVNEIPVEAIDEANQALEKLLVEFRKSYKDEDL